MIRQHLIVCPLGAKAEVYGPFSQNEAHKGIAHLERLGMNGYDVELRNRGDFKALTNDGPQA